ncbi:unnamed protein product, partial [marine sediment metagenome]
MVRAPRFFVLGAGFSQPGGLPLGKDLFAQIVAETKRTVLYENILKPDIEAFIRYLNETEGQTIREEEIDFEQFMSYLDIEHFLDLRGSDTWSSEGNRSQLVIRNFIALVLHKSQREMSESDLSLYRSFAERLSPRDVIVTFNYDTVLERALKDAQVPFRLFPQRYTNVSPGWGEVDTSTEEVILLKM